MDPKHGEKDKRLESEHDEKDEGRRPGNRDSEMLLTSSMAELKLTRREDYIPGLQQREPSRRRFQRAKRHGRFHSRELAENNDFIQFLPAQQVGKVPNWDYEGILYAFCFPGQF